MSDQNYRERAWKIVNRLLPELPNAHGFYEPAAFILSARRSGDRNYFFWMVFAKLRAKTEGEGPHIDLPENCEHSLGGGAMWNAAKALERDADAAWAELCDYILMQKGMINV